MNIKGFGSPKGKAVLCLRFFFAAPFYILLQKQAEISRKVPPFYHLKNIAGIVSTFSAVAPLEPSILAFVTPAS